MISLEQREESYDKLSWLNRVGLWKLCSLLIPDSLFTTALFQTGIGWESAGWVMSHDLRFGIKSPAPSYRKCHTVARWIGFHYQLSTEARTDPTTSTFQKKKIIWMELKCQINYNLQCQDMMFQRRLVSSLMDKMHAPSSNFDEPVCSHVGNILR